MAEASVNDPFASAMGCLPERTLYTKSIKARKITHQMVGQYEKVRALLPKKIGLLGINKKVEKKEAAAQDDHNNNDAYAELNNEDSKEEPAL